MDWGTTRSPILYGRQSTISGKYGGVCTLPDDAAVMCLHCAQHADLDFQAGDNVVIAIKACGFEKKQTFGRILVKW